MVAVVVTHRAATFLGSRVCSAAFHRLNCVETSASTASLSAVLPQKIALTRTAAERDTGRGADRWALLAEAEVWRGRDRFSILGGSA